MVTKRLSILPVYGLVHKPILKDRLALKVLLVPKARKVHKAHRVQLAPKVVRVFKVQRV